MLSGDIIYHTIVCKLIKIFESDCLAEEWLLEPNRELQGKVPMDILRDGDPKEVLALVEALEGKFIVQ